MQNPVTGLYPLRLEPIYRRYLWGGRRLASSLGKPIGQGNDYAESWEIVDHGDDQSIVNFGPRRGASLASLCGEYQHELFGHHAPQTQFPLLFKFLDAHRDLSVQVHPNDEQAAQLDPPDRGKTEAWVILHADPGSSIYAGVKSGIDRAGFELAVRGGAIESVLHQFQPAAGDCVFIPAGTVHALGAGLLVAEIQQSSDTTYRISDWNRVGSDGRPRPLHIEQALAVIDFEGGPVHSQSPRPADSLHVERLVACDHFVLDRWRIESPASVGGDGRFHLLAVLDGGLRMQGDVSGQPLLKGQTALVPACCECLLEPEGPTLMLDVYLP